MESPRSRRTRRGGRRGDSGAGSDAGALVQGGVRLAALQTQTLLLEVSRFLL